MTASVEIANELPLSDRSPRDGSHEYCSTICERLEAAFDYFRAPKSRRRKSRRRRSPRFKEHFHRVQNRWAGLAFIDGFAQRAAARNSVGEPGCELFHLALGVVAAFVAGALRLAVFSGFGGSIEQHLEVGADDAIAVHLRRLIVAAERGVCGLAEDPGIGGRGAADHHRITVGLRDHRDGVFRSADVFVADDRDADRISTAAICSQRAWPE